MPHPYRRRRPVGVVPAEGLAREAVSSGTAVAKAPVSVPFAGGFESGGKTCDGTSPKVQSLAPTARW